jgi:hypothetical protein
MFSPNGLPSTGIYQTFKPSYKAELFRIKIFLGSTFATSFNFYLYRGNSLTSAIRSGTYPVAVGAGSYFNIDFEPIEVEDEELRFSIVCPSCTTHWTTLNPYPRGYMNTNGNEHAASTLDTVFWAYMIGLSMRYL